VDAGLCTRNFFSTFQLILFITLSSYKTKIEAKSMQDQGKAAKGEGIRGIRTWRSACWLRDCVLGRGREATGGRPRKEQPPPADGVTGGARTGGGQRGCWRRAGRQRPKESLEEDGRAAGGEVAGQRWERGGVAALQDVWTPGGWSSRGRRGRGPGMVCCIDGRLACIHRLMGGPNMLSGLG
jgi:hypothetical protein